MNSNSVARWSGSEELYLSLPSQLLLGVLLQVGWHFLFKVGEKPTWKNKETRPKAKQITKIAKCII